MPFKAESKLSGATEQAANFAALENTSLDTGRLADMMSNSTSQNQFNQMLHSKLNSIVVEPTASANDGTDNQGISEQELSQIVKALREQLDNIKRENSQVTSEESSELNTDSRSYTTTEATTEASTEGNNSQAEQWLTDLAQELNRLINQPTTNQNDNSEAGKLPAWLAEQMRSRATTEAEIATDTPIDTHANVDSNEASAAENKYSQSIDELQWLVESENQAELSAVQINQLLATNIEQASPKQLEQLALLSGLSVEQLEKIGQLAPPQVTAEPNSAIEQPVVVNDNEAPTKPISKLIEKLEQLIKPLANNQQLQAQLQQLKQAVTDADSSVTTSKIEQLVEQRVSQPISALINQAMGQLDGGQSVYSAENPSVGDDIDQQIKSLINQLPVKDQQQLAAAVTDKLISAEQQKAQEAPAEQLVQQQAAKQAELAKLQRGELAPISASVAKALEQSRNHAMETSAPGTTASSSAALSDMSAATMVSNQVNLNAKQQTQHDNSQGEPDVDGPEFDEQELAAIDDDEQARKNNTGDNIDRLLKQFEPRVASPSQAANAATNAATSAAELASAQAAELDASDTQALATKEPTSSQKVTAEQQLAKLPLGHDAQAARVLKEQMSMMVKGDIQQAIIQLDPEELGGMSIRMQLQNDQMSVQFQVQNAQAKELLENAMSKLKEMLDQQGIVLADSDVQHQDSSAQQETLDQHSASQEPDLDSDQEVIVLTLNKQSADGIDYYA